MPRSPRRMRPQRILLHTVLYGLAVGAGATVSSSCTVNYPTVAFQCNPRQQDNCPETHVCCSTDPAAEMGALPNFMGKNISGGRPAFFAGANNTLGTKGMCVRVDDIPTGSGLLEPAALNCPIPCNPTWTGEEIGVVCGPNRVCCQTTELEPEDCVLDAANDEWRPVTGADIGRAGITPVTMWRPGDHATHQDAGGQGCLTFAGNEMNDAYLDCVGNLTVADQRGFCMSLGPGQQCPTENPAYLDVCEQITMGLIPPPGTPGA